MRTAIFFAALLSSAILSAAAPIDGLYATVFGGYAYVPDNMSRKYYGLDRTHAAYRNGYHAGGAIGFQSYPLRYEGQITYLHTNLEKFYINNIRQNVTYGYNEGLLAMAVVYYDFPEMVPSVAPYLGAGLGYAWLDVQLDSRSRDFGRTYYKGSNNVFAIQGTAGLNYNFAENYALNIAYRYLGAERPKVFGKFFQAHLGTLGVVYRFDDGNYK